MPKSSGEKKIASPAASAPVGGASAAVAAAAAPSKASLLDWQALVSLIAVLVVVAIFHLLRQRNEQLAMAWAANMAPVFDATFTQFPATEQTSHGAYAQALCKLSDHEFELRATGRALSKGALVRMELTKSYDALSLLASLGPPRATCTIHILIESERFGKYEFGFVRAAHEADVRARLPWFPPTQAARPTRLPGEFVPVGDRNSAMLFEALFATDLVHWLQPGRLDVVSYFLITDRFPSSDHQVVATVCVAMPEGLDLQRKEVWEAHQLALMITVNASSRAANGDVARPVNLIRNVPGATAAAAAAPAPVAVASSSSASDATASSDASSIDAKRQKQIELELAAQERKEAKLRQERERLANNKQELEKFEMKLAKKKQRRQIKIVR